ncbi:hypothetical protein JNB62_05445 [Microbacterium jejuense]|uniref:DUF7455 domain-containing protein n=1 Tax=Microbacterium jejuense TaxID=1263637 RepID=A0ABS7HL00_9MICO|nr:hypothetical protein [Microbacterium jejuense]MBW9093120.1 hypothetical protein [Microbacterium jejuense]
MDAPPQDIVDRIRPATVVEVVDDICHACGPGSKTRAYLYAKLPNGETRAYCGHHGTEKLPSLKEQRATIIDLRDRIEP